MLEYHPSFFLYSASLPMQAALKMYIPRATETAAPTPTAPKDALQGDAGPSQRKQARPKPEPTQQKQADGPPTGKKERKREREQKP